MFWLMMSALMVMTLYTGVVVQVRKARACRRDDRFALDDWT